MTAADRQRRHYQTRTAQGFTRQCFWLTPAARNALDKLHTASGQTRDEIVCMALLEALESNGKASESNAPPRTKQDQAKLLTATEIPPPEPDVKPSEPHTLASDSDGMPASDSNIQASDTHSVPSDSDAGISSDSDIPADRRALADVVRSMREAGRTLAEIADEFNRTGRTPDKFPSPGKTPRRDSAQVWTIKTLSQLINRDYPVNKNHDS